MKLDTSSSPFIHSGANITGMMLRVCLALVPAIIAYTWFFGWGLCINIFIAVSTAVAAEALMLRIRQRPLKPFLSDGSAVVTGLLRDAAHLLPPGDDPMGASQHRQPVADRFH